jgi:hypothetical protein
MQVVRKKYVKEALQYNHNSFLSNEISSRIHLLLKRKSNVEDINIYTTEEENGWILHIEYGYYCIDYSRRRKFGFLLYFGDYCIFERDLALNRDIKEVSCYDNQLSEHVLSIDTDFEIISKDQFDKEFVIVENSLI